MTVEELQNEMKQTENKIATLVQALERNGIRFKELEIIRTEIKNKDSGPRPVYVYKCYIKTEVESSW